MCAKPAGSSYLKEHDKTKEQLINDLRIAERSLSECENKFKVLAEISLASIFVYQGERLVYADPSTEHLLGYSEKELSGMKLWDWVHTDFKDLFRKRELARQRGEQMPDRYEVKFIRKDGAEGWIEITAGYIEFRGKPAGLITAFDITERKKAEEELRDAKAEAEMYVDLIGHDINNMNQIAMGYLDLALDLLRINEKLEKKDALLLSKPYDALKNSSVLIDNVRKLQQARSERSWLKKSISARRWSG